MLWLAVFAAAFLAEFAGDAFAVYYQQAVRKLWRGRASRWAGGLALLGLVDLGIIWGRLPFSALAVGVVSGSMAGTYWAVTRQSIKARLRKKRREEREKGAP